MQSSFSFKILHGNLVKKRRAPRRHHFDWMDFFNLVRSDRVGEKQITLSIRNKYPIRKENTFLDNITLHILNFFYPASLLYFRGITRFKKTRCFFVCLSCFWFNLKCQFITLFSLYITQAISQTTKEYLICSECVD